MKRCKFWVSLLTAASLFSVMPVTALAASDNLDVNNDGAVNSSDTVFLNRYLLGLQDVTDLNKMDVTGDFIVDSMDLAYMNARFLGNSFEMTAVDTMLPLVTTQTQSRTYWKYVCGTNSSPTSYTLTQSIVDNGTSASCASLFPDVASENNLLDDNRVPVDSNFETGIVKIFDSNGFLGTGFVVGDNVIATAAHVVYHPNTNTFREPEVMLFTSTVTPYQRSDVEEIHIPVAYDDGTYSGDQDYDYALLYLDENLSGYTHFDLGAVIDSLSIMDDFTFETMGFPESFDYDFDGVSEFANSVTEHMPCYVSGGFDSFRNNVINHYLYTSDGQSGSPVYNKTAYSVNGVNKQQLTAVSIIIRFNSVTATTSLRMTAPVIQFYKANPNIG